MYPSEDILSEPLYMPPSFLLSDPAFINFDTMKDSAEPAYAEVSAVSPTTPMGGDWSTVRHTVSEEIAVYDLMIHASTLYYEAKYSPQVRRGTVEGMMNAVFAYAQRRAPMISAVYANLPATGISSLIDYEWRQLLPQIEKDYWNDLCQKARRLYEETYCHRSPPTGLTSIPPATSPHTAAVNRSAGTNYVPQIITKKNPFPRTFSNQSILGTSQKVSNGTLHPSTQRSTHSLTRGSRGPRTSATSPSRPPPNLCKALPKRRKSSPRTMYEPNPVSYERSSTGRFVAIPPAPTLPTLRAGMPLDIPRTISEPGPSSSDLGFGLQLSGHGLGSSTTSSHYSTSVIADTLKSPMSYYPNTTYPIQGPLHNYIVPMSSSYAPPVTTPPLNTFTNPMATVAIGPEY